MNDDNGLQDWNISQKGSEKSTKLNKNACLHGVNMRPPTQDKMKATSTKKFI